MLFNKPKGNLGMPSSGYNSNPNLHIDPQPRLAETPAYQNMEYSQSPYQKMKLSGSGQRQNSQAEIASHKRNSTLEPPDNSYAPFVAEGGRK
jgi:hypothetical protein